MRRSSTGSVPRRRLWMVGCCYRRTRHVSPVTRRPPEDLAELDPGFHGGGGVVVRVDVVHHVIDDGPEGLEGAEHLVRERVRRTEAEAGVAGRIHLDLAAARHRPTGVAECRSGDELHTG